MTRTRAIVKNSSTLFLRGVIYLLGLVVLAICLFALPPAILSELRGDFDYGPVMLGLYVSAVPFFMALYFSLRILGSIERGEAFSLQTVTAFKKIKYAAIAISALFSAWMPYVFWLGDRDDAPGVVAIGFIIVFASAIFATFAAVMQRLFQNAVDIKAENELTV